MSKPPGIFAYPSTVPGAGTSLCILSPTLLGHSYRPCFGALHWGREGTCCSRLASTAGWVPLWDHGSGHRRPLLPCSEVSWPRHEGSAKKRQPRGLGGRARAMPVASERDRRLGGRGARAWEPSLQCAGPDGAATHEATVSVPVVVQGCRAGVSRVRGAQ